jgi:transposase-like protein
MHKATPKATSSLGKIVCSTIGHNYKETNKINEIISEYRCSCCGHEVTENDQGSLETLTPKMKDINACLSAFIEKKMRRTAYSQAS